MALLAFGGNTWQAAAPGTTPSVSDITPAGRNAVAAESPVDTRPAAPVAATVTALTVARAAAGAAIASSFGPSPTFGLQLVTSARISRPDESGADAHEGALAVGAAEAATACAGAAATACAAAAAAACAAAATACAGAATNVVGPGMGSGWGAVTAAAAVTAVAAAAAGGTGGAGACVAKLLVMDATDCNKLSALVHLYATTGARSQITA